ncbi:MAG: hypothetical protein ACLR13_06960 [Acutalibacteraceae bacterium]
MREKARAICGESSLFSDWILSCALSHTDGHQLRTCYGETASFAQFFTALEHACGTASETGTCHRRNEEKQKLRMEPASILQEK